jgi:cobalt/nickel transport system ATP-binding protein
MSDAVAIHVEDLTFAHAHGPLVLQGVRFTVDRGECVGLIGPNGAGKTTLFLCLAGVYQRRGGLIRIGGLDPAAKDERKKLPSHVGIVFQDSDDQLFNTTVLDDVAFGPLNLGMPPDEVRARVTEALERVGLAGFEQRVPFHLSGGEKRRVALAGVLAMRPEVLLLDEPSSHLDPRGRRGLIRLIQDLGGTRLIATHDLEMVLETCSRCVLLDGGKLVAEGPPRTLLADAALMESHGLEVPHSLRYHPDDHHRRAEPGAEGNQG